MNAYLPRDATTAWLVAAVLVTTLGLGLAVTRMRRVGAARLCAWALVVAATLTVERLCAAEPAGLRMLAVIGALLYGMKAVVSVESHADGQPRLTPGRWVAF